MTGAAEPTSSREGPIRSRRLTLAKLAALCAVLGLVLAAVGFLARAPILTWIGARLIHADDLVRSDLIVVLAGGTPVREIEAADLYVAGYAPRVALTVEAEAPGVETLRDRGIPFERAVDLRKRLLMHLGVPEPAVVVLNSAYVNSTKSETELVRDWMTANRARRVIVVTSSFHSRRAALTFRRALRGSGADVVVRPASHDTFRANDWWHDRQTLRNGLFEWQKLMVYSVLYR